MSGIVKILPWIVSFLIAAGITTMQAIGGGGRPMFPLLVSYLPIVVAAILSLPAIILGNNRRSPNIICLWCALIFGVYLLVRTCVGGDPGLRSFELLRLAACVFVYLATISVLTAKGPRLLFLGILLVAAFLQTVIETYQFYCDQAWAPLLVCFPFLKTYYAETVGTFANKNHLAWFLCDGALFSLAFACWGRIRWVTRGLLVYIFLFLGFGVCISMSRGGIVALMSGLIMLSAVSVFLLLMTGDQGKLLTGILTICLVLAVTAGGFVFLSANPSLGLRMQGLWMDDYREDLWRASIHDLGNSPFLGTGAATFQWSARMMMPAESLLAHNDYAQLLSEYGLMGFLLLVVFLAAHLKAGFSVLFRHRGESDAIGSQSDSKAIHLGALAAVTAELVHSFFDFNMHLGSNAMVAAFCLGILGGDGLHGGHHILSLKMRGLQCAFLIAFAGFFSCILLAGWNLELRFFHLEQSVAEARFSGKHPLTQAAAEANSLLSVDPDNSRYADLRVSLYRTMVSKQQNDFREPVDRINLKRQLDHALPLCRGDWYLWMNQSFLLGYLGKEEGAREAFLQAMVCMPLYALVYSDRAAVLEELGDPETALHYARVATRFKEAAGLEAMIHRLEEKVSVRPVP